MKRAVPFAVLVLALAGCGTSPQSSSVDNFSDPDEKAVAQKIEDLESAGKRNKPDDICSDILVGEGRRAISSPPGRTAPPR